MQVLGISVYSTLGWFKASVISTFINYPDVELAHQVLYVKDDTDFNELFATSVEEADAERWLTINSDDKRRQAYRKFEKRKTIFLTFLLKYR